MTVACTAAARNALGVLEKLEGPNIKVYQARCVEVRNRNAGCHACADACASGAIEVVDGLLNVRPELCIGCGTCATVCPTCALEARHPEDDDLLANAEAAMRANGGHAVFACTKTLDAAFGHCDEGRVTGLTCLGRIDESLIAALVERGCETVTLVEHRCETCEHAHGFAAAQSVLQSASCLLEAWGHPIEMSLTESLPASVLCEKPYESAAVRAEAVAADAAPAAADDGACMPTPAAADADAPVSSEPPARPLPQKVGRDGTLAHHVPNRRGRLLASLAALGEPAEVTVGSRLWGTVGIDTDACGSCRLCAVFCPTGALRKIDDRKAGAFGLEHTPAKCVKCRCCVDVCPKHAVSITEEVFAPDIVDGHTERFDLKPPEFETGKPTTVINKMRKLLVGANQVNFA